MNRSRPWTWLAAFAVLLAVAACSDDDDNQPPTAEIVYPDPGFVYTTTPDSVVVDARDDSGVRRVEITLDGTVISTDRTAPYSTRLPLGRYADGQEHVLDATAFDAQGARGDAAAIRVTIDPSLQTVPQVAQFAPPEDGFAEVVLRWLTFPEPVTRYEWELAASDAFAEILAAGDTADTAAVMPLPVDGLAYARVRAVLADRVTDWSRTARYSGLATTRERYVLAGPQLATRVITAPDGTLRILSHGVPRHRVAEAPAQLLQLDGSLDLVSVTDLLATDRQVLASLAGPDGSVGDLFLAGRVAGGGGFVARATLADAQVAMEQNTGLLAPGALASRDGTVFAFGADLRGEDRPGGVIATVAADGEVAEAATFALADGREVQEAWPLPDGGWFLAGSLPPVAPDADEPDQYPGGIWARGIGPDGGERWSVRLGTADRWLLRGGGADASGRYLLTGIAFREDFFARYGFVACIDAAGDLLWTVTDRDWHLFAQAAPDAAGRWTVVGARRRSIGDRVWQYDTGLHGFSPFGAPLWEIQHQASHESQGWSLAAHPDGGWWAAGTVTSDGNAYDVDLLRTDDRGAID